MRADLRNAFSATGTISWKTSAIEVARSADLAYEQGRYTYTTTKKRREEQNTNGKLPVGVAQSRPAAIGRSRSIQTPRIRRSRHLRRFRHLRNNPRE
jgi:hypothetical protein